MAQRYVRVQSQAKQLHYGLLQPDRRVKVLDAPPWLQGQTTDLVLAPDSYMLLAPCAPSKVIGLEPNYPVAEAYYTSAVSSQTPALFLKPPTSVIGTEASILYPPQTQQIDYEGELAIVIGEQASNCSREEASQKIWGYTIANDITARDLQIIDGQWTRAKGFDTFCPLGPWIVRDLSAGAYLKTFVNGCPEPCQLARLEDMLLAPDQIVAYVSKTMTLLPGDIILTGTPSGPGPLQVGDLVRVEVEGIGTLQNQIISC